MTEMGTRILKKECEIAKIFALSSVFDHATHI